MIDDLIVKSTVWIIIPTFNRRETLRACIADLVAQTYSPLKIVVVDDASNDGTADMLKNDYPDVVVLKGDGDRWWSGSMNLGLGWVMSCAASQDFIISFNDDVLVSGFYVQTLIDAAATAPIGSLIGSLAIDSSDASKIVYCGTSIDWRRGRWKGLTPSQAAVHPKLIPSDSLPGRGVLVPYSCIKNIGFYDDRRFPQYFGDEDFALRAKAAGANLFVSRLAVVRSHVQLTGTGRFAQTLSSFFTSLWSIRSPNQLSRRISFIWKNCPKAFRLYFSIFDLLKVITAYWRRKDIRS